MAVSVLQHQRVVVFSVKFQHQLQEVFSVSYHNRTPVASVELWQEDSDKLPNLKACQVDYSAHQRNLLHPASVIYNRRQDSVTSLKAVDLESSRRRDFLVNKTHHHLVSQHMVSSQLKQHLDSKQERWASIKVVASAALLSLSAIFLAPSPRDFSDNNNKLLLTLRVVK
jgi:hypothetical protein